MGILVIPQPELSHCHLSISAVFGRYWNDWSQRWMLQCPRFMECWGGGHLQEEGSYMKHVGPVWMCDILSTTAKLVWHLFAKRCCFRKQNCWKLLAPQFLVQKVEPRGISETLGTLQGNDSCRLKWHQTGGLQLSIDWYCWWSKIHKKYTLVWTQNVMVKIVGYSHDVYSATFLASEVKAHQISINH